MASRSGRPTIPQRDFKNMSQKHTTDPHKKQPIPSKPPKAQEQASTGAKLVANHLRLLQELSKR